MVHRPSKAAYIIESLVCFGGATANLVFGLLAFPLWTNMLIAYWSGEIRTTNPDENMPWSVLLPMLLVVLGVIGLVGLIRVSAVILRDRVITNGRHLTLFCAGAGIASLVGFNLLLGGIDPREAFAGAMVYTFLPAFGACHLLYSARHSLFPRRTHGET